MRPPAELEVFCESNKERLVGLLTLYCGDRLTAEDLAQEALAKVCLRWRSVRRMANPEAWMFRVGINLANSYFRRVAAERRARERIGSVSHDHDHDSDPTDAIAVRQALADLPKRQRSVLVLRFYADLSVREVAEALDIPEGTVKTLTRRALKRLEDNINPFELKEVPNVG